MRAPQNREQTTPAPGSGRAAGFARWISRAGGPWHVAALAGVLCLTVSLHFYRLGREGYANLYYAAAVKSMLKSWHNFFFVSFDPGGFVSVDKPPVGLWVQAASAAVFGFHGWTLILPQAVAGVAAVLVLYYLVRRTFGPTAGLIAALVLAVTPITVAADRNNTMDAQLVLTSLLAAWALILAAESGRPRWLLACAVLVGIGFNIKMLQATMVLPAFVFLYLLAAPHPWIKRVAYLSFAGAVLVAVSLSWAITVDLTPTDRRPYVGSSRDNTVMELITGHNGASRLGEIGGLIGLDSGGPGPGPRPPTDAPNRIVMPPPSGAPSTIPGPGQTFRPPRGIPPAAPDDGQPPVLAPGGALPPQSGDGGLGAETGEPGVFRLFNKPLAGQASWLLPLVAFGLIAVAAQERVRLPLARRHQALLLWAAWLIPQMVFFSFAGLFHRYYLEMMAPAIAALVGAGFVAMWNDLRRSDWRRWLLPAAFLATAAVQIYILADFPDWSGRLTPVVLVLTTAAAGILVVGRKIEGLRGQLSMAAAGVGLAALLIAPLVWAAIPVWQGGNAGLPYAGPQEFRVRPKETQDITALAEYLTVNRDGATFLVATLNANTAAPIILETGDAVMALGGFSGSDPILTTDELAAMVDQRDVRFFLIPASGASGTAGTPRPPTGAQGDLARWVNGNCTAVDPALWREDGQPVNAGAGAPLTLFDCAPPHPA